jgi:deazaflavin-dependent oxidoreductase (nitroreductase family)
MSDNSALDFMRDHIKRYLATDGEDGYLMNGFPCLILTTTGKKSGEPRQAAVIFGQDGDSYVVVASKGGSDQSPAWFHNLVAHPHAQIQVKADKFDVTMRITEGQERERLWHEMVSIFPEYAEYQKKTEREIPVLILEPVKLHKK